MAASNFAGLRPPINTTVTARPSGTQTTLSWGTVSVVGASVCFDDWAVACTSTCASVSPTLAIATTVIVLGTAAAAAKVQSVAAAGDPSEYATPGVPASDV